jgi:uncharacterized protein YodC (DUF2158 family)
VDRSPADLGSGMDDFYGFQLGDVVRMKSDDPSIPYLKMVVSKLGKDGGPNGGLIWCRWRMSHLPSEIQSLWFPPWELELVTPRKTAWDHIAED